MHLDPGLNRVAHSLLLVHCNAAWTDQGAAAMQNSKNNLMLKAVRAAATALVESFVAVMTNGV